MQALQLCRLCAVAMSIQYCSRIKTCGAKPTTVEKPTIISDTKFVLEELCCIVWCDYTVSRNRVSHCVAHYKLISYPSLTRTIHRIMFGLIFEISIAFTNCYHKTLKLAKLTIALSYQENINNLPPSLHCPCY